MNPLASRDDFKEAHAKSKLEPKPQIIENEVEDEHQTSIFDEEPEINEHEENAHETPSKYSSQKEKHNRYIIEFKPGVFIEYLLLHFLYFLIGPFIIIFSPLIGYKRIKNLQFIGWTPFSRLQLLHWASYIAFFFLYNYLPNEGIFSVELYMLLNGIIFRCIMVAMKYAYANEMFLNSIKNEFMSLKESYNEQSLPTWRNQGHEILHKELQAAILTLDIESSLFFFEFLGKVSRQENMEKLTKKYEAKDFESYRDLAEGAITIVGLELGIKVNPKNPGNLKDKNISKCHKAVLEDFQSFLKKKKLAKKKLSGYNLCVELIQYGNKKILPKLPIAIFFSILRALVPIIYRIAKSQNVATSNPGLEYSIVPVNFMLFLTNYLIILVSAGDQERQAHILAQLGSMISPRKISSERKIFPTMNIFDPITLHTWIHIRKILPIMERDSYNEARSSSHLWLHFMALFC